MSVIAFSTAVGPVPLDVVLREKHESDLTITRVPVEVGADMTDHAFMEPSRLSLEIADSGAAATWTELKRFQESRVPFVIVSGLDVYRNMLIKHIEAERDASTARILSGKIDLDEVLIAETAVEQGGESTPAKANPGGRKSTRAAKPNASRAKGNAAKARSSGTVSKGDVVTKTPTPAKSQSILKALAG